MRLPGRLAPAGALVALAALLGACGPSEIGLPPPTASPAASPAAGCTPSPTGVPSASPSASPAPPPSPSAAPPPPAVHLIKIVLSAQHLWAYDGAVAVVSTDVATGRPDLPTPTGRFHLMGKNSPYLFISPWPKGSPYYYAPTWVSYAMPFAAGGYYIHDATWQRNWGPGANVRSGSHGCVNVPLSPMRALYGWARVGDAVIVTAN